MGGLSRTSGWNGGAFIVSDLVAKSDSVAVENPLCHVPRVGQ